VASRTAKPKGARRGTVAGSNGHDPDAELDGRAVKRVREDRRRVPGATGAKPRGRKGGTSPDFGPFHPLSMKRMVSQLPPPADFVVELLAARGELTEIWGGKGLGKSLLCEEMTRGVATGTPVAGLECKRGRVLYVDSENGRHEIWRRVHYLKLPERNVRMIDAMGAHLIKDEKHLRALIKLVQPDLVIYDSLRRLTGGLDENDSRDMAAVMGLLMELARGYRHAAVLIHHPRKDGTESRGSGAIGDQVTIEWKMERVGTDRHLRKLTNHKMRCAEEPKEPLWLRTQREDGSFGISRAEAPAGSGLPVSGPAREPLAQDIVDALHDVFSPISKPELAKKLSTDPKGGTFRRTLEALVAEGVVAKHTDVKPIKYGVSPPPPLGVGTLAPGDSDGKGATPGASGDSVATKVAPKRKRRRHLRLVEGDDDE
jgi:AAA domain